MTSVRRLFCVLVLLVLAGPAFAAPLEAYGRLPSIEVAALSASGKQVAVVVTNGEERRIVVKDLDQNKVTFVATLGRTKVRDLRWAGDQHLILSNSHSAIPNVWVDHGEFFYASDIDLATKTLHPLLMNASEDTADSIADIPTVRMIDGQPIVFAKGFQIVNSEVIYSVFRIDLARRTSRVVEHGLLDTYGFVLGPSGETLAQALYRGVTGEWSLRTKTATGWREVLARVEPTEAPEVLGLGRDGRSLLVALGEKDDFAWREVSLDTGALGPEIPHEDGQTTIHDPRTDQLIGVHALVGDESRYTFFAPADAAVWKAVEAAYPGDRVSLVGWSDDRRKILVRVDSAVDGPAYAIVDLATRSASWLGAEYESLKPADISPVQPVRYKAADGVEISGYLTLPRGRDPKSLPLVVFPHGGPAARDTPGFDWWAQGMAARGYAVLQVNFRGSTGFGWDFQKAGFGEWGGKMQTDLSDGVRYLAGQGTIDPKRVCIVGASYGGYAALAGVTVESGVYRCAVSFGGVADLKQMISYDRDHEGDATVRYWKRYMGAQSLGDPILPRRSPAQQAAAAGAPILLIAGKDDSVVPSDQSTEMADALRRAGKPVELVVQDNADHWLSLGATRLQMLQATMAFVEKNNPPN